MDWVFGYASLVALRQPVAVDGEERAPLPGRLRGYRRLWGAAMDNWDAVNDPKHFVDPDTGDRPRIRVAYLDIHEREGSTVNGLALPVDATRLAALDEREVNYERIELTGAFEPGRLAEADPTTGDLDGDRVWTYVGTAAARERCRLGAEQGNACVAAEYAAAVRAAFASLAPGALAEFDRSTDPLPFPQRPIERASL